MTQTSPASDFDERWPDDPYSDVPPPFEESAAPERVNAEEYHRRSVDAELNKLRIREEAKRLLAAEKAAGVAARIPDITSLGAFLSVEDEPASYRIDGVLPVGARAMLAAQYKAGKSTSIGNLLRSLADGDRFFGKFEVHPPDGAIVLIDDELDQRMLRRWLREHNIRKVDRVMVVSLRGRVSSFGILDEGVRAEWARMLAGVGAKIVILDCLRPVLDALGLSEDKDAGRFLVAFDELLAEGGVDEAVVVHHMGHSGERSRGDSRLQDWPDVLWRIVREKGADGEGAPDAPRYFSAYGRDVNVLEGKLDYTPETRELTYIDGDRKQAAALDLVPEVVALVSTATDGISGHAIETAMKESGHARAAIRAAIELAIRDRSIYTTRGARNAKLHHLNPSRKEGPAA